MDTGEHNTQLVSVRNRDGSHVAHADGYIFEHHSAQKPEAAAGGRRKMANDVDKSIGRNCADILKSNRRYGYYGNNQGKLGKRTVP